MNETLNLQRQHSNLPLIKSLQEDKASPHKKYLGYPKKVHSRDQHFLKRH